MRGVAGMRDRRTPHPRGCGYGHLMWFLPHRNFRTFQPSLRNEQVKSKRSRGPVLRIVRQDGRLQLSEPPRCANGRGQTVLRKVVGQLGECSRA